MLSISFTYSILKKRKPNTSNSYRLSPPANLTAKLLWPVTPHWGLNGLSLPHLTYQCIRHSWSLSLNHLLFLATRRSPYLLCILPCWLPCHGLFCFPHLISLTCKDWSAQAHSPCVSSGFCLNSVSRWSHDFKDDLNASDARISVSSLDLFSDLKRDPHILTTYWTSSHGCPMGISHLTWPDGARAVPTECSCCFPHLQW